MCVLCEEVITADKSTAQCAYQYQNQSVVEDLHNPTIKTAAVMLKDIFSLDTQPSAVATEPSFSNRVARQWRGQPQKRRRCGEIKRRSGRREEGGHFCCLRQSASRIQSWHDQLLSDSQHPQQRHPNAVRANGCSLHRGGRQRENHELKTSRPGKQQPRVSQNYNLWNNEKIP